MHFSAASVSASAGGTIDSPGSMPFRSGGLKSGAMYAIGIETAAARLPLMLAPLQAGLRSGQPCVLVTHLDPQDATFASAMTRMRDFVDSIGGIGADRLQVFTAVGDYAVNLVLHGPKRYVEELEKFVLNPGSLVVIDQADDLFTLHDHAALVLQSRTYQEWCARHGHTMVQLHLRSGLHQPMLAGNQAATQYLSGVARVQADPVGLMMRVEFWDAPDGVQTGLAVPIEPMLPLPRLAAEPSAGTSAGPIDAPAEGGRPLLWYVGTADRDLRVLEQQFELRVASSLDEVLPWQAAAAEEAARVLVALGPDGDFAETLEQIRRLRAALGRAGTIVVRESRHRLREHTQKRQLLRGGVDGVVSAHQPLAEAVPLLLRPSVEATVERVDAVDLAEPWWPESAVPPSPSLGAPAFVEEVEQCMRRSLLARVPCALAEVEFEPLLDADDGGSAPRAPVQAGRSGDLTTVDGSSQFFFLHGCGGRDVVNVVSRCMDEALAQRVQRIHLYTGEAAIVDRLTLLRRRISESGAEASIKASHNVVAMPASGRSSASRSHAGTALLLTLAMLAPWTAGDVQAQVQVQAPTPTPTASAAVSPASRAFEQERYPDAARLGLAELQREPANHALRMNVANSLAWTGQYAAALEQYRLLTDTPFAQQARIGQANVYLWSGRPHLAEPLFRRAAAAEPANADARQGLTAAGRQVRPRTTVRAGLVDDSTDASRTSLGVAHRWRDAALTQVFEVSAEGIDESRSPGGPDLQPRKLGVAYQHLGLPLAPKVQLTSDTGVKSSVYSSLSLQALDGAVTVDLGRVNWGELAFDPRARRDGLSARRAGVAVQAFTGIGAFSGNAAHFAVSDGNAVQEFGARYTPAWQPFPAASGVKAVVGVYGRKADRRDPRYWTPVDGYYVGQFGVAVNRSAADWDLSAELKRSQRIGGEGAQGWTVGFGGTRWLNRDWALRVDGFHIETRRDASAYRSRAIAISVDRVW
jgi:hypothetical protein